MISQIDIAWAAGLFEGEGCIFTNKEYDKRDNKSRYRERLVLVSTDEDVVKKFHSIVGGNTVSGPNIREDRPNEKPTWRWNVSSKSDVERILNLFLPYLGIRRKERALLALERINARPESWVRERCSPLGRRDSEETLQKKRKAQQERRRRERLLTV